MPPDKKDVGNHVSLFPGSGLDHRVDSEQNLVSESANFTDHEYVKKQRSLFHVNNGRK